MEEENIVEVKLSLCINGDMYEGTAKVDTSCDEVELCDSLKAHEYEWAYHNGQRIGRIGEILRATALHEADCDDGIILCYYSGYWFYSGNCVYTRDDEYCNELLAVEWDGDYYYCGDCSTRQLRRSNGDIEDITAPKTFWENCSYCDCCDSYIENDDDYWGDSMCIYCHDERYSSIIEDYSSSHHHAPIFFGEYKKEFAGLGFELEVDGDYELQRRNGETAEGLCSYCGLEEDEMRYAYDGSLNNGFEIISQPHTIKDFWDKMDKWRKMLSYLSGKGYKSHDAHTCGLHVHVSRVMFGKTEEEQNRAIAKVYTFFDENWNDIVLVSRRKNFDYCEKNSLPSSERYNDKKNTYEKWKVGSKSSGSWGHHVALNNGNTKTFEYRLGRGTLNTWSFFSWIDFVLTVTKNARRITVDKVTSNDKVSWLGGIKESTAKYIYKMGAFRTEVLALFPNIEWETDLIDNSND